MYLESPFAAFYLSDLQSINHKAKARSKYTECKAIGVVAWNSIERLKLIKSHSSWYIYVYLVPTENEWIIIAILYTQKKKSDIKSRTEMSLPLMFSQQYKTIISPSCICQISISYLTWVGGQGRGREGRGISRRKVNAPAWLAVLQETNRILNWLA